MTYKALKIGGRKINEHRLIWERHNGQIPREHVVHHRNEDKRDNRIENLELMTKSEHTKYHTDMVRLRQQATTARRDRMKEMLASGKKRCPACKEVKTLDDFYKSKEKSSGYHSSCKTCYQERRR